jgi:hypothetical protein
MKKCTIMEHQKIMRKMKEMQKEIDSRGSILFFSSVMLHFSHIHEFAFSSKIAKIGFTS